MAINEMGVKDFENTELRRLECTTCDAWTESNMEESLGAFRKEHAHAPEADKPSAIVPAPPFAPIEDNDEFAEIFEESKPPDLFVVHERYGLMPPTDGDEEKTKAYLKELHKQVTGSDAPIDDSKVGFYISDRVIDNQKGADDLYEYSKNLMMLAELQQQPGFVTPNIETNITHLPPGPIEARTGFTIQPPTWQQLNQDHVTFYGVTRANELWELLLKELAGKHAPAYWTVGKLLGVCSDMHRVWVKALEDGFEDEAAKS